MYHVDLGTVHELSEDHRDTVGSDSSRRGRECEIAATGCFLPLRHNVQRLPGPSCTVSSSKEHRGGGPGSGRVAID